MRLLFAGSFDPFTLGHASLVERALPLCSSLVIAIGVNSAKGAAPVNVDERLETIRRLYADEPKVSVVTYSGLTVDAAAREGADALLRGVRSVADFEYERNLADVNRRIAGIETILLFATPELSAVSSSVVRELAAYGHPVSDFLPKIP